MDTTLGPRVQPPSRLPTPTIRVLYTPTAGFVDREPIRLSAGATEIGREGDGIVLDDPRLSRNHVRLTVTSPGKRLRIQDLDSRNGVFVRGTRVHEADLADGDVLRLADCFLLVRYQPRPVPDGDVPEIRGWSPAMGRVRQQVAALARAGAHVLVQGPSGSGKEVVARALHDHGRRTGSYVPINCSAIPEALAESQLFGHVAGAFTGAQRDNLGVFREADAGTLFLDEIGELTKTLQPKLLRVLEEGTVRPVGSSRAVQCDVRVVAATNRDLETEADRGEFRGDLFARLAQLRISLPPLMDRPEDTAWFAADRLAGYEVDPELAHALLHYDWPYNVRELLAVLTDLTVRGDPGSPLTLELVASRLPVPAAEDAAPVVHTPDNETLRALLAEHKGNVTDVARATGRSRAQVYRWLKEHNLELDDFRD